VAWALNPKATTLNTSLHLAPSEVLRVFHAPGIEVDGGSARDLVDTACKLYLLWQSEYPQYVPTLRIDGRPGAAAILNRALFGHA
jgi:hypothetical protein